MKLEFSRDDLVRYRGRHWWQCGLCLAGASSKDGVVHLASCPFADPTVEVLFMSVGPMHNTDICGRCNVEAENCPVGGCGWDSVTHKRLMSLCILYSDRAARLRKRKLTLAGHDVAAAESERDLPIEIDHKATGSEIKRNLGIE